MPSRSMRVGALLLTGLLLAGCSKLAVNAENEETLAVTPDATESAPATCDASYSTDCVFGQTALYSDTSREGEMRLEITVGEPVEFQPSAEARFTNNMATAVDAQAVNVYFPVTIKNVSPELTRESGFVFGHATNDDQGEYDVATVDDGDAVKSFLSFAPLAPGQSVELKNGWSMSTLDGVEYEVSIDGLSGHTVTFSR